MFDKLEEELQYLCTAALTVCAVFAPMHVYRGFGACVFGDWHWGCPDFEYLEKKAKKDTSVFAKMPDPQPNRPVLLAFDRAIQVLQVKSIAFLKHRPSISGFSDWQPRFKPRPKKEVSDDMSLCKDWAKQLEKRGHPSPPGMKVSSWGLPWAGWLSDFNCRFTKDWEEVMLIQMDPGRLLHAFLCRGSLNLHDGQMLALPPGTSAESLACWLAGRPAMTHKIIRWECFQTSEFEKKVGKKMAARLGRHPLPSNFVIRNPNVSASTTISPRKSTPSLSTAKAPPPYSPSLDEERSLSPTSTRQSVVEIGNSDPAELESNERPSATADGIATGEALQKSMTSFRRKPAPATAARHASAPALTVGLSKDREKNMDVTADTEPVQEPPSRPPKEPISHSAELSASSPVVYSSDDTPGKSAKITSKPDAHYLELLNAVARGEISRQKLQDILESGDPMTYITAEPQELSNDPPPPKLMGVPIPLGEIKPKANAHSGEQSVPTVLRPGSSL
ncbi:hypothetical protein M409DRAFT_25844 [Zasmidium cellare ATCC 36951]|uniref:Uncharacterized protein n=1 Tax=Zasmidium cellare ATCC 36951 TaxID=1080233 RepID=A0A6A6C8Z5_ZASCE|nr:uncharacterized protein M409DRAFT_25844 [Zasmidium cellare ATCC 36951]KAF2163657.1 hypothetical protein M409DRAFT_25844 [Zasmidium cellare ATCC 36951]